jgi:hypothetical protein
VRDELGTRGRRALARKHPQHFPALGIVTMPGWRIGADDSPAWSRRVHDGFTKQELCRVKREVSSRSFGALECDA